MATRSLWQSRDDLAYQVKDRSRAVEPQDRTVQLAKPGQVAREAASFPTAILVVGGPFDKVFGFLVAPASWRNGIGTKVAGLLIAQPSETDLDRCLYEDDEIKQRRNRVAPTLNRSAQDPVGYPGANLPKPAPS